MSLHRLQRRLRAVSTPHSRRSGWLRRGLLAIALAISPLTGISEGQYWRCTFLVSVNIISYDDDLNPRERQYEYHGLCVFGKDKWLIQTRWSPNITETYFCDGSQVIRVQRFDDDKIPEPPDWFLPRYGLSPSSPQQPRKAATHVTVMEGTVPFSDPGANVPWLAFCSSMYLNLPDRLIPLPTGNIRRVRESFGYVDRTDRYADTLALPKKVVWVADQRLMRRAPRHWSLNRRGRSPEHIRLALSGETRFPHGFERAVYEVTSKTNLGGYTIPLNFRLTSFRPYYRDGRPLRVADAFGEVRSLEISDAPGKPLLDGHLYHVIDYRFRHPRRLVDYIRYQIEDGVVPLKSDPILQALYEEAVSSAAIDPVIRSRHGFLAVYGLMFSFPAIAVLLWLRSRARQHNPIHKGRTDTT